MNSEIWKDIKDYEGLYQISNLGNIKSVTRKVKNKKYGTMIAKEKILKQNMSKAGYFTIGLCKNGKTKTTSVHRLVASTFILNPKNKPCINHLDNNPSNNNVKNLEWCTQKENIQHACKSGNMNGVPKKINQYDLEENFIKTWKSMQEASRNLKIPASNICYCCKGYSKYSHAGGFIWRYYDV